MYQYSLEWFVNIFLKSIANADAAGKIILHSLIKNIYRQSCLHLLCIAYMNCRYCISTALENITISRPVLLLFHVEQTLDTSYYLVIAMMVKGKGLKREIVASLNVVLLNNLCCYSIFFFIIGHLVSQVTDYH